MFILTLLLSWCLIATSLASYLLFLIVFSILLDLFGGFFLVGRSYRLLRLLLAAGLSAEFPTVATVLQISVMYNLS